ncbi:hypothetical protein ACPCAC_06810 [Streptomyces lavendulocolor]|uniref:hypothetical protein n=1 Tax=Streptomyces lavendulocolor TaxID=67316 RepID=UPI003C2DA139
MSRYENEGRKDTSVTPPLPITVPRPFPEAPADLSATEAHRVMLHCALDTACVPLTAVDAAAIDHIAALDYSIVNSVIS